MAKYNCSATITLSVDGGFEIPQEVIKRGNASGYIEEQINYLINTNGFDGLKEMKIGNIQSITTKDYIKVRTDADDIENDLMEFDIFD